MIGNVDSDVYLRHSLILAMSSPRSVAVALSGGVDSAITAYLLKRRGFDVIGVFMRNWDVGDGLSGENGAGSESDAGFCRVAEEMNDAAWTARKIGIGFKTVSFVKEYWNDVFTYVMNEYSVGRTPNGDMLCNEKIKFDVFLKYARETLGVDAVATGHYVRSSAGDYLEKLEDGELIKLLRGSDVSKDQSFFLSRVKQDALRCVMFPLGSRWKRDVKALARSLDLNRLADKEETMGVCFVAPKNFHRFILDFLPPCPGPIKRLEPPHETLGRHHGLHTLTVGQGVRGKNGLWRSSHELSKTGKFFVAERCAESNTVYVVEETKHPALFADSLIVEDISWISGQKEPEFVVENDAEVSVDGSSSILDFQYNNSVPITEPCVIARMDDRNRHFGRYFVRLKRPFRAITPGQFAVFYRGDELLGSGKTLRPGPSLYERMKAEDVERGQVH